MEAAPPPYEKAVAPQKWELIAPYLSSRDLCSAARVCQQWHSSFTPHIWGDPSSHFEDRFLFREDPSSHFEDRFLFREDRYYGSCGQSISNIQALSLTRRQLTRR